MYEAARLHDSIVHTEALTGFLIGAAIGTAFVIGGAFAACTFGLGGIVLGLALSTIGTLLPEWGEEIKQKDQTVTGSILSGSPNVFINGRNAAYAEQSEVICDKHSDEPLVAEGSEKVLLNGLGAARKGDRTTCGATIESGSHNVFIGAESRAYLEVEEEVSTALRIGVGVGMFLAGLGRGGLSFASLKNVRALKPCLMKFAAVFAGGYALNMALSAGANSLFHAASGLFGNPVDAVNGRKVLLDESETDFALPGLLPITWSRFYASDIEQIGLLGRGWVLPWEQTLQLEGDAVLLKDSQGRDVRLDALKPGESIYYPDEKITLVCTEGGHYLLKTLDDVYLYFGELHRNAEPARLQRIEDALGHYIALLYRDNLLTDLYASGELHLHLSYNEARDRLVRIERIVNKRPVETLVRYGYDTLGQLVSVTNRNGDIIRRFAYDQGRMSLHESALGLHCHYRYAEFPDSTYRVIEHWTNDGEHYQFNYDLKQQVTYVSDGLGRSAKVRYNEAKRVVACQYFGGESYAFDIDDAGNTTSITLPNGSSMQFEYDEFSRLVAETDPLGRITRYEYNRHNEQLVRLEHADGSTHEWQYDRNGILLKETDTLGEQTHYISDDDGRIHTIRDPLGNQTHMWWNELGQVLQSQDCSGNRTHYTYDEHQHLCAITNALGQTTRLHRKPDGEILRVEHPDATTDHYSYNALGHLLSHADADGHTTYLSRNIRGLPVERKDAKGQRVRYHYDQALRLAALVNENGAAYRFAYDSADRLIEEVRIDGLRRRFHYNVSGALIRMDEHTADQTRQGQTRSSEFERDAIGRLLSKMTQDARLDYIYDELDRVVAIERQPSEHGKTLGIRPDFLSFSYDKAGRLAEEQSALGALAYTYDALGNLTQLSLPDGRTLNHLYYGSGHLHQLNLDGLLISDFERDALHRETLRTQGSLTSRFGYDSFGRKRWQAAIELPHEQLSQLNAQKNSLLGHPEHPATLIHRRYEYSKAGELLRQIDKHRGITDYKYDAIGQLRSREPHHPQLGNEDFGYDPAGNLSASQALSPDNRLKAWKDLRLTYDAWGNVSERHSPNGYQRFTYDCENRLVKAETYRGHDSLSQASYEYDCLGRRIAKHVLTEDKTETTHFLWQGLRMLQEQKADLHSLYIYETGSYAPLARLDTDPSQPDQKPKRYYFHTDQIGTPLEVTDSTGRMVWRAYYKTWGALEALAPREIEQNLRFQGQYYDAETGLHYNTFRYYDPVVGRFTAQDPIGLLGGINLHQYAINSITRLDPLGLSSFDPFEFGEITSFPKDVYFGQDRISPNFSTIASQAHHSIVGRPISDVAQDIRSGKINPNIFTISYTIDPASGKAVTINNRGLAALVEAGKFPDHAILIPYDKVPKHLVSDIKNRSPMKTISVTKNKDGSGLIRKIGSCK